MYAPCGVLASFIVPQLRVGAVFGHLPGAPRQQRGTSSSRPQHTRNQAPRGFMRPSCGRDTFEGSVPAAKGRDRTTHHNAGGDSMYPHTKVLRQNEVSRSAATRSFRAECPVNHTTRPISQLSCEFTHIYEGIFRNRTGDLTHSRRQPSGAWRVVF